MDDSSVYRDIISGDAGGIYYIDGSQGCKFTINSCLFSNNQANLGGVMYALKPDEVYIKDSSFNGNSAV